MKVIIEHDDSCPKSHQGKARWVRTFEELSKVPTRYSFDQVEIMRAHADKWAELARIGACNCGADEEIKRREEIADLERVAVIP